MGKDRIACITSEEHLIEFPLFPIGAVVTTGPEGAIWFNQTNAIGRLSSDEEAMSIRYPHPPPDRLASTRPPTQPGSSTLRLAKWAPSLLMATSMTSHRPTALSALT